MKLEVGMYARIDGKIGKIIDICECEQCKLRGYDEPIVEYAHGEKDYVSVYWKDNLKASHNIIDLIEEGDYVNGYKVHKIANCITIILDNEENISWVKPSDIKSIVTKEQFESMSYKVGE